MTDPDYIQVEKENQIGIIRLNRPKQLNAINRKMVSEILQALEEMDKDEEIRVMVLTGNGKSFAAGADIDEMAEDTSVSLEWLNQFADWDRIHCIKKPLIGAIHGFALGGGFELALSCDILFCSEDVQFGFPEIKLAVMPGAGGTQKLTKLMGRTKALEWLWSGEMMPCKEAMNYGVVNKIIPAELLWEETMKYARSLAAMPPLSVRMIKDAVNKAVDYSLYEGMQYERKNFYLLFSSEDQKEGMKAFIEKRKPDFKGR